VRSPFLSFPHTLSQLHSSSQLHGSQKLSDYDIQSRVQTSSTTQYPNFKMSINEFFDFAAACGESSETGPSSSTQAWATSSSPFNEELHKSPTPDNNHGAPSYSSSQPYDNPAGDTTAWAEMEPALHQHQSINNMAAATFSLLEQSNVWAPDSSISPTKAVQLNSSAPTETQDRLHCDPPTETILGLSQGRMDDQQFQDSSMMERALPSECNQSE
jgi:hypothetical protein